MNKSQSFKRKTVGQKTDFGPMFTDKNLDAIFPSKRSQIYAPSPLSKHSDQRSVNLENQITPNFKNVKVSIEKDDLLIDIEFEKQRLNLHKTAAQKSVFTQLLDIKKRISFFSLFKTFD